MPNRDPEIPVRKGGLLNCTKIYFEDRGEGEPLLLLHGFSGSSQDWVRSLESWGGGLRFLIPDLRGHGRPGILSEPFRHADAAADILALLDRLGIENIRGAGVSGGGNVLLHMAARQPERMRALVLLSATRYFPAQARAIMRAYAASIS